MGPAGLLAGGPGTQTPVTSVTSEYFRLGLNVTCSVGHTAYRAKGRLPVYPPRRGRGIGKVCSLPTLAPLHPLLHLDIVSLNHQMVTDLSPSGLTPCRGVGTRKGRDWVKVKGQGKDCPRQRRCETGVSHTIPRASLPALSPGSHLQIGGHSTYLTAVIRVIGVTESW